MSLIGVIIVPRLIGPEGVGQLHLANSLWNFTSMLIIFGMDTVMVKEIARDHKRAGEFVGTNLLIRTLFFGIGFLFLSIYVNLFDYSESVQRIVYIFGGVNFTYQVGFALRAALNGMEEISHLAVIDAFSRLIGLILLIGGILWVQSVETVAMVTLLGALVHTTMLVYLAIGRFGIRPWVNRQLILWLPREGIPYLLTFFARNLYVQIDVIVISWFVSEKVLGWYSAADVAFGTMLFLPTILDTVIFPALSRLYTENREPFVALFRRTFNIVMIGSVGIGFGVIIIAGQVMPLLLGDEFRQAGIVLRVFGVVLIFTAQNVLLGSTLNAIDQQRRLTVLTILAVALTIPIDLMLIPWFEREFGNGAIGGAAAYVVTEGAITLGAILSLPRTIWDRQVIPKTLLTLLAGLIMLAGTWWARDLFLPIPIILGAAIYLALVVVFRLLPAEDWAVLRHYVTRGWAKVRQMTRF